MHVTSVRLNYPKPKANTKLKAFAKVILDNELIITSIKVMEKEENGNGIKRFIVFPEYELDRTITNGERVIISYVNPIVSSLREEITEAIFEVYDSDPYNPINKLNENI